MIDSRPPAALARPGNRALVRSRLFIRLLGAALPGMIALILISVAAITAFQQLDRQTAITQGVLAASARISALGAGTNALRTWLDRALLPGVSYNSTTYQGHRNTLTAAIATLKGQNFAEFTSAAHATRKDQLVAEVEALLPDLDHIDRLAATSTGSASLEWVNTVRGQMGTIDAGLINLSADLSKAADQAAGDTRATVNNMRWGIVALSLLAILISLGLAAMFARNTIRPILRLRAHMIRVATGDLTPNNWHPNPNGDELETLELEYQRTLDRLGPLIRQIQEDASHISSSAAEISASATQQASGSSEQAAAITEVTVTVEELNQTAVQIAEAAASVAAAAEQALVSANRGQDAVRDSILGMAMIKSRVNDITSRILALSEQSQQIGEVIDLINQIAARTHILALNAAVESAGAGEQGRRFGVVAAEVKKLAQRSVAATKEVRGLVVEIQAATAAAVMATEEGLKETDRGVTLAHQSGDANEDIISMVERTAQLANAISLATQQQRTASEQVVATMREVAEVTRQAAISSRQAAAAANQLSAIAGDLRGASQGFRLDSGAARLLAAPAPAGDEGGHLPAPLGEPA